MPVTPRLGFEDPMLHLRVSGHLVALPRMFAVNTARTLVTTQASVFGTLGPSDRAAILHALDGPQRAISGVHGHQVTRKRCAAATRDRGVHNGLVLCEVV